LLSYRYAILALASNAELEAEMSIFSSSLQNNHNQAKRHQTATKKPSQTFHPTPVFSAILSILRMVPFNLTLVLSKLSFILSASAEESRISSPMAMVSCLSWLTLEESTLVFSFSFCDSRDSRTEWEYWPLQDKSCQFLWFPTSCVMRACWS
jgi:hypothetical protein